MTARATSAARPPAAIWRERRGLEALLCVAASVLMICVSAPPIAGQASDFESVRREALHTYYHGITAEMAQERIGAQGVPALLELLADPSFARRDNVVAFPDLPGGR